MSGIRIPEEVVDYIMDISEMINGSQETSAAPKPNDDVNFRNLNLLAAVAEAVRYRDDNGFMLDLKLAEDLKELEENWQGLGKKLYQHGSPMRDFIKTAGGFLKIKKDSFSHMKVSDIILATRIVRSATLQFKNCDNMLNHWFLKFATSFIDFLDPTNVYFWEIVEFMIGRNQQLECEFKDYYFLEETLKELRKEREEAVKKALGIMAVFMANTELKSFEDFQRNCKLEILRDYIEDLKLIEKTIILPLDFMVKALFFIDRAVYKQDPDLYVHDKQEFHNLQKEMPDIYKRLTFPSGILITRFVDDKDCSNVCPVCLSSLEDKETHSQDYFIFCSKDCKQRAWHNRVQFDDADDLITRFEEIFDTVSK